MGLLFKLNLINLLKPLVSPKFIRYTVTLLLDLL